MCSLDITTNTDTNKVEMLFQFCELVNGLTREGIIFTTTPLFDGVQVRAADWDAVCHMGSIGHQCGLFEIMGSIVSPDCEEDGVEGFLTAQDILDRL